MHGTRTAGRSWFQSEMKKSFAMGSRSGQKNFSVCFFWLLK
jgi:hypothetical protein